MKAGRKREKAKRGEAAQIHRVPTLSCELLFPAFPLRQKTLRCFSCRGGFLSRPVCQDPGNKNRRQLSCLLFFHILILGAGVRRVGADASQQLDAARAAGGHRLLVPKRDLHLADVGLAQQQHAQAALADATADGQGELAV